MVAIPTYVLKKKKKKKAEKGYLFFFGPISNSPMTFLFVIIITNILLKLSWRYKSFKKQAPPIFWGRRAGGEEITPYHGNRIIK